jgi:type II secretory pathway predicted ATPase ExeA
LLAVTSNTIASWLDISGHFQMQYTQYWRITHSPFIFGSRSKLYEGGSVEEAIARIRFVVKNEGACGLLVGPSLVGKTVLLKSLTNQLSWSSAGQSKNVYLSLLGLDIDGMISALTERLSVSETLLQNTIHLSRERRWSLLEDALRGVAATSRSVVLFLDDAHAGTNEIFSIIRRVTNSLVPVTCIMAVSDEQVIDMPRTVVERCQLRISLPAWDLGQTADYFEHCMDRCKGRDSIFEARSITRIQELAVGLPYRINYLADLCLVAGALRRLDRVTADLVDEVASELAIHVDQNEFELASFDPSEPIA